MILFIFKRNFESLFILFKINKFEISLGFTYFFNSREKFKIRPSNEIKLLKKIIPYLKKFANKFP